MSETNWTFGQNFYADFQASRSILEARIDAAASNIKSKSLPTPAPGDDELQKCAVELAKLTKSLGNATGSLPGYDQRQCELQLKAIEKTLEDLRVSLAPKAKFAFQRKTKPSTATPLPPPPEPAKSTQISDMHTNLNLNPSLGGGGVGSSTPTTNVTLVGQSNRYLTLRSLPAFRSDGERGHSDLTLSDLDGCIVNLLSPSSGQMSTGTGTGISAVHVRNVTNTVLFLPADIRGSVILHGLVRCIVVVGCHQFRMHNSRDVDVYLSIPSNPIIEHSSGIRFAAYPALLLSSGSSSHVKDSKHTSVQDFSHIRPTQSPNWSVMHDEDRPVQDWFEPLLNMNEGEEEKEVGSVLLDGVLPRSDTAR